MTVRDLMEILTAFDPDMNVLVREPFDGNGPESWAIMYIIPFAFIDAK